MEKPRVHLHPEIHLLAMCLLVISAGLSVHADSADASLPSTRPTTAPSALQLRQLVAQTGSDDPQVRQSAFLKMMDLKAEDLPALRDAAVAQGALLPGQVAIIRQAVAQVFLEAQPYDVLTDPGQDPGFLGLEWDRQNSIQSAYGVVVSDRLPGFVAYRVLQPGDIISKIIRQPDAPDVEINQFEEIINEVSKMHAGDLLRLEVLRYGRRTDVSIRLDHRPAAIQGQPQTAIDQWLADRAKLEEQYWNREFQAIDGNPPDSASSQP